MNILYVENNRSFADVVSKCFLKNHKVIVAETIRKAKAIYPQYDFPIILVDYDLDDGKGTEFLEYINQQPHNRFIIAVSSHKNGNHKLKAAGANCICAKSKFSHIENIIHYFETHQLHLIQDFNSDFCVGNNRKNRLPKSQQSTDTLLHDLGFHF